MFAVDRIRSLTVTNRPCQMPLGRGKSKPGQQGNDPAWRAVRQEIVVTLAQLFQVQWTAVPCNSQRMAFYILLAGLTCVADWIGSDERYFPYTPEEPGKILQQFSKNLEEDNPDVH